MTVRIDLAAGVCDHHPVHMVVPDERALATIAALHMLDAQRRAAGTTPVIITNTRQEHDHD